MNRKIRSSLSAVILGLAPQSAVGLWGAQCPCPLLHGLRLQQEVPEQQRCRLHELSHRLYE